MAKGNGKTKPPVSDETRRRQSRAHLSLKQQRFIKEYAHLGNGAEAARRAGYKNGSAIHVQAHENLRKPKIADAIVIEQARIEADFSAQRVRTRLDALSHAAQADGQYGAAVRAEELLGKAAGMWIDLQLKGELKDEHIQALLAHARTRQAEPIDLTDDETGNNFGHSSDGEDE
jgi:hypothetical protein